VNPQSSSYFGNASMTLANGLTPFAQNFSYGGNTQASSASQRNAWQSAAATNGAGPNANNSAAPFSFDQFALGLNPFVNPGTGQPVASGTIAFVPLVMLAIVILLFLFLLRKI
jgi:hypothetical protein